ncbi:hypothetical protein X975_05747, partial [Stegodyphus mimosarum]
MIEVKKEIIYNYGYGINVCDKSATIYSSSTAKLIVNIGSPGMARCIGQRDYQSPLELTTSSRDTPSHWCEKPPLIVLRNLLPASW